LAAPTYNRSSTYAALAPGTSHDIPYPSIPQAGEVSQRPLRRAGCGWGRESQPCGDFFAHRRGAGNAHGHKHHPHSQLNRSCSHNRHSGNLLRGHERRHHNCPPLQALQEELHHQDSRCGAELRCGDQDGTAKRGANTMAIEGGVHTFFGAEGDDQV
jgi:hypothetical protein